MSAFTAAGFGNEWSTRINNLTDQLVLRCLISKGFAVIPVDRTRFPVVVGPGPNEGDLTMQYRHTHGYGVAEALATIARLDAAGAAHDVAPPSGQAGPAFDSAVSKCRKQAQTSMRAVWELRDQLAELQVAARIALAASADWAAASARWSVCIEQLHLGFTPAPDTIQSDYFKFVGQKVGFFDGDIVDTSVLASLVAAEVNTAVTDGNCRQASGIEQLQQRMYLGLAQGQTGQVAAQLDAALKAMPVSE